MDVEVPYKTEYAKSGRASCKMCKNSISEGSLRLAALVQSAFHDGKQAMWYHEECFFKKQRPLSVGDIDNFENMRFKDQERIRLKVDFLTVGIDPQQRNLPNKEVMESEMIEEENDNVSNDIDLREQSTSKRFRTSSLKHELQQQQVIEKHALEMRILEDQLKKK